tara:strand:- start:429 stop:1010 length:582 start_codon:yes stop_codon:yes gene_type:complete
MYRQEEKFFINNSKLINILNHFKAYSSYPVRKVNSIYFDTYNLDFFYDGEEGVVPRNKCRFRWYGNPLNFNKQGSIEIKTTLEHYKEKNSIKKKNFFESSIYFKKKLRLNLYPMCQISYDRAYFVNKENFRFTLDYNIKFKKIENNVFYKIHQNIFEIKYLSKKNNNIILSTLADKKTRFSKYNEAILKLQTN